MNMNILLSEEEILNRPMVAEEVEGVDFFEVDTTNWMEV